MAEKDPKPDVLDYAQPRERGTLICVAEPNRIILTGVGAGARFRILINLIPAGLIGWILISLGRGLRDRQQSSIQQAIWFGVSLILLVAGLVIVKWIWDRLFAKECLTIAAEEVEYINPTGLRLVTRFLSIDLDGVRIESRDDNIYRLYYLRLFRKDQASRVIFRGFPEKELREAAEQVRLFLSLIRPSPMEKAIVPPRPKL